MPKLSASKKKALEKAKSYRETQEKIMAYAHKYNFHVVITGMMNEAFNAKSTDPLVFMAKYMLEKKGLSLADLANDYVKNQIKEKDDLIEELQKKIKASESNPEDANSLECLDDEKSIELLQQPKDVNSSPPTDSIEQQLPLQQDSIEQLPFQQEVQEEVVEEEEMMEINSDIMPSNLENVEMELDELDYEPDNE